VVEAIDAANPPAVNEYYAGTEAQVPEIWPVESV
jgi:hypothetical protein